MPVTQHSLNFSLKYGNAVTNIFFLLKHQNIGIIGLIWQNIGKYRERPKILELIGIIGPLTSLTCT